MTSHCLAASLLRMGKKKMLDSFNYFYYYIFLNSFILLGLPEPAFQMKRLFHGKICISITYRLYDTLTHIDSTPSQSVVVINRDDVHDLAITPTTGTPSAHSIQCTHSVSSSHSMLLFTEFPSHLQHFRILTSRLITSLEFGAPITQMTGFNKCGLGNLCSHNVPFVGLFVDGQPRTHTMSPSLTVQVPD